MIKQILTTSLAASLVFGLSSCGDPKTDKPAASGEKPAAAPAGEMKTIKPEWPKEQFVGTPVPTRLPNLEEPDPTKVRKQFDVPATAENVAAGKTASSSDEAIILGSIEMATDGDKEGSDGSFMELAPGKQWLQVDLGAEFTIHKLLVWHRHKIASAYKDVVIQISSDAKFENGVTTVWNSDEDNSLGFGEGKDPTYIETNHGRVIDVADVAGRYVRFWSNGNTGDDMNHYTEVEIWGSPVK
jgi:hypothetical protein